MTKGSVVEAITNYFKSKLVDAEIEESETSKAIRIWEEKCKSHFSIDFYLDEKTWKDPNLPLKNPNDLKA